MYRRAAWEQTGGFDERLFMYLEDVDLAWRLRLLGWDAVFAPAARLYHHLASPGGGTLASYYVGRNTIWVIAKDMPGPLIRRHLGAIVRAQWLITLDALRAWRGESAGRGRSRRTGRGDRIAAACWAGAGRRKPLDRLPSPKLTVCESAAGTAQKYREE